MAKHKLTMDNLSRETVAAAFGMKSVSTPTPSDPSFDGTRPERYRHHRAEQQKCEVAIQKGGKEARIAVMRITYHSRMAASLRRIMMVTGEDYDD